VQNQALQLLIIPENILRQLLKKVVREIQKFQLSQAIQRTFTDIQIIPEIQALQGIHHPEGPIFNGRFICVPNSQLLEAREFLENYTRDEFDVTIREK
jgi:hypothetical protein